MEALSSTSAEQKAVSRGPSTPSGPFSPQLDADLASIIVKVEGFYGEGKRTFVIVPHRDPDADAMAGCMGMDRLIRGLLPGDVSIRWMHDGTLCEYLRQVCGSITEPLTNLPKVLEAAPHGSVAVVVVDQTGLHSSAVLPASLQSDIHLKARQADVVLDHHGEPRHEPGLISAPEAGCTAALVYRLLELAKNHDRFRNVTWSPEDDARFALLVNMGARTDSSQKVSGPLSDGVSPHVRWAVEATDGLFEVSASEPFDVLAGQHEGLVRRAREHAKVYPKVLMKNISARVLVTYAGVVESPHFIGACADLLLAAEKQDRHADDLPIGIVVCGVLAPPAGHSTASVHAGERVHVSIRTEAPVDAEHMAELISVSGGGRIGSAAAQLTVPELCEDMPIENYMLLLLSYIEMKLTWHPDSWWH